MNYLVLHATHGPEIWNLIYEGRFSEVQAFLLTNRFCPPEHYRIVVVDRECDVLDEARNESFLIRTSK